MYGDMYEMDDELPALLIEAHKNIGFSEGLLMHQGGFYSAANQR